MPNPFRSAMHSDDGSLDRLYPQMWPLNGIAVRLLAIAKAEFTLTDRAETCVPRRAG
jgi:hypothetical protein